MTRVANVNTAGARAKQAPGEAAPSVIDGVTYVTDKAGRRIGIKKLKPSERYLLTEAVDPPNISCSLQALAAASVVSIGEEGQPKFKDKAELLRRIDELGDEGFEAITPIIMEIYGFSFSPQAVQVAKK